jgi:hypothetical protein
MKTPDGKSIDWDGEMILEKFHLRSVLLCRHCNNKHKDEIFKRRIENREKEEKNPREIPRFNPFRQTRQDYDKEQEEAAKEDLSNVH